MRRLVVAAALFGTACAAAHDPAIDASTADAGRDDLALLEAAQHALCERYLSCVSSPTGYVDFDFGACNAHWWDLRRGDVISGRSHVDLDAARECIARVAALAPCPSHADAISHPDRAGLVAQAVCDEVLVEDARLCGEDTCAPGDACIVDADCIERCRGLPGPGEPCTEFCRYPSRCLGDTCSPRCSVFACLRDGFDGCGADGGCVRDPRAGDACDASHLCAEGLVCLDSICRARVMVGAPCDATTPCVDEDFCDDAGRCRPLLPIGATCPSPLDRCDPYVARCDPTVARCVALPGVGESCTEIGCAPPLICDLLGSQTCFDAEAACVWALGLCGPGRYCHSADLVSAASCEPDPHGSYCERIWYFDYDLFAHDAWCPDGYECANGECLERRSIGERCDDAFTGCEPGAACVDGVCVRSARPWEPCSDRAPCLLGYPCVDGACVRDRIAPGSLGGRCIDGVCSDGGCVDGWCVRLPPGAACPRGHECAGCVGGVCTDVPLATAGQACGAPIDCAPALTCAWDGLSASRCCAL